MALAIKFDGLLRDGKVADQSELARLAHVTQPRMTQIMNLLHLARDIQEELLFLPLSPRGGTRSTSGCCGRWRRWWGGRLRGGGGGRIFGLRPLSLPLTEPRVRY